MKNKSLIIGIFLIILLAGSLSAVGEISSCCEKLAANGASCQNAPESECDPGFKIQPTSCESTSYCKLGTCVNSIDGTCMPNTPEAVCDNANGIWKDADADDIPQCQLGCCLIGDQAAFVTQTRCGHLASIYGLEIDFRSDISSEIQCIMNSGSEEKGACVFDQGAEITCRMTSKTECLNVGTGEEGVENAQFHEGFLCSAEELGSLCSPSEKTTCVEGRDEVYFLDTCGNVANIYDEDKLENQNYWTYIVGIDESCGYGASNANDPVCGNCDYMQGSTCGKAKFGDTQPTEGNYICKDLSCEFDMERDGTLEKFEHGESWCYVSGMYKPVDKSYTDKVIYVDYDEVDFTTTLRQGEDGFVGTITEGVSNIESFSNPEEYNLPGTRHFRLLCYNGEVMVEPCADYRNEICTQGRIDIEGVGDNENGFLTAVCRLNLWQDCIEQTKRKECEDLTKRDCVWFENDDKEGKSDFCAPLFAPGFNFWEEESDAELLCSRANDKCTITYERKIEKLLGGGDDEIIRGKYCATSDWQKRRGTFSQMLGDCGNSNNYLGNFGDIGGWLSKTHERGEWN